MVMAREPQIGSDGSREPMPCRPVSNARKAASRTLPQWRFRVQLEATRLMTGARIILVRVVPLFWHCSQPRGGLRATFTVAAVLLDTVHLVHQPAFILSKYPCWVSYATANLLSP
jgi:hypothetical protein